MTGSFISLPLRLGVRTARASLKVTRDLAELGLGTLELVARVLGEEPGSVRDEPTVDVGPVRDIDRDRVQATPRPRPPRPVQPATPRLESIADATVEPVPVPEPPEPLPDDRELVEEVADPGAESGAGASLRVAPPFAGYDALRAADVIARLRSADIAELGETELYERTHRARRTVLEAIARELKRRPAG